MLQFFPGDKKIKYAIYLYAILWYALFNKFLILNTNQTGNSLFKLYR